MLKHLFFFSLSIICLHRLLQADQDYWKGDKYHQHSSSQKNAAADLLSYVSVPKDAHILDVGCGDGQITAKLSTLTPQGLVIGLDISPSMIAFAKSSFAKDMYSNLDFQLGDAQELHFKNQFDLLFSFTTLQWIQDHNAFLKAAYRALKPSGLLAITMPLGLPSALERTVNDLIQDLKWAPYFIGFTTGWNFVDPKAYGKLLADNQFTLVRLAVVPQKDIFPSRQAFEQFISQWFPYLRPLPEDLRKPFLKEVLDQFLCLESPFPNGEVHFKINRIEVVVRK